VTKWRGKPVFMRHRCGGQGGVLRWGRSGAGVDVSGWQGARACLRLAAIRMCCRWRQWEHAAAPGMQLAACRCCQLPLSSPLLQPPRQSASMLPPCLPACSPHPQDRCRHLCCL
jgi:hypothetical protein